MIRTGNHEYIGKAMQKYFRLFFVDTRYGVYTFTVFAFI